MPDDIKGVVVFPASEASRYVTGENILMDGGMHCWPSDTLTPKLIRRNNEATLCRYTKVGLN